MPLREGQDRSTEATFHTFIQLAETFKAGDRLSDAQADQINALLPEIIDPQNGFAVIYLARQLRDATIDAIQKNPALVQSLTAHQKAKQVASDFSQQQMEAEKKIADQMRTLELERQLEALKIERENLIRSIEYQIKCGHFTLEQFKQLQADVLLSEPGVFEEFGEEHLIPIIDINKKIAYWQAQPQTVEVRARLQTLLTSKQWVERPHVLDWVKCYHEAYYRLPTRIKDLQNALKLRKTGHL